MKSTRGLIFPLRVLLLAIILAAPARVWAKPSAGDVFKSIQDNVNDNGDESMKNAVPWICAAVGVILIFAFIGQRQAARATPKALNSPSRLAKEVMRVIPLRPRELKQVKLASDEMNAGDPEKSLCSPLVLLLCPSVLTKASKNQLTRADRNELLAVLKKLNQG